MDIIKMMDYLEQAVRVNTCRPAPDEEANITPIYPRLDCSPTYEGHGHLGVMLFIGIANTLGIPEVEVMLWLAINSDEYNDLLGEYRRRININKRFQGKVGLINNYVEINCSL